VITGKKFNSLIGCILWLTSGETTMFTRKYHIILQIAKTRKLLKSNVYDYVVTAGYENNYQIKILTDRYSDNKKPITTYHYVHNFNTKMKNI